MHTVEYSIPFTFGSRLMCNAGSVKDVFSGFGCGNEFRIPKRAVLEWQIQQSHIGVTLRCLGCLLHQVSWQGNPSFHSICIWHLECLKCWCNNLTDTQIGKGHRFAELGHKKICFLSSLFPESSVQNIQGVALSWHWLLLLLVFICVFVQ